MKINKRTKFTRAISLLLAITMVSSMISFDFFDVLADINSTPANSQKDKFYLKLTGENTKNITIEARKTETENNTSSDTTSSESSSSDTTSSESSSSDTTSSDSSSSDTTSSDSSSSDTTSSESSSLSSSEQQPPINTKIEKAKTGDDGIAIFENFPKGIEYTFTCTINGDEKKVNITVPVKKDDKPVMMEWNLNPQYPSKEVTEYFQVTLLQDEKGTLEFESKENIVEKDKVSFVKDGNSVKVIATANANSDYMVKNILVKNIFGNKKSQAYQNILIEEDTEISAEYKKIPTITIESDANTNPQDEYGYKWYDKRFSTTVTVVDDDKFDKKNIEILDEGQDFDGDLKVEEVEGGAKITLETTKAGKHKYKVSYKYVDFYENERFIIIEHKVGIYKYDSKFEVNIAEKVAKVENNIDVFNKNITVTIKVKDIVTTGVGEDNFNKDNIQIKKDGNAQKPSLNFEEKVDKTHTYSFDLTEEGTYTISYKDSSKDDIGEKIIKIDKSIPEIKIAFDKNGTESEDGTINFAESSINATVTVEFGKEMTLDQKKLAEIVLPVGNDQFNINIPEKWDCSGNTFTKEISIASDLETASGVFSGNILVEYLREDGSRQTLSKNFKLNITSPKPTIKYYKIDNTKTGGFGEEIYGNLIGNTRYFKEPVMYRVLVEKTAVDSVRSTINISPNGSLSLDEIEPDSKYILEGKISEDTTCEFSNINMINYSNDPVTVAAFGKDRTPKASETVVVDETAPIVTSNSKVGFYKNATVTFTIEEKNFDEKNVKFDDKTQAIIEKNPKKWNNNGDTYTMSIEYFNDEFEPTLSVTDLAGKTGELKEVNKFTADNIAPEIKANYNEEVAVDGANGLIEKFTINEEYEYLFKKTIQILLYVDDKAGNQPSPIENKTSGIGKYQYRLEKDKKWGEWKDLEQSKVNKNLFTILYEDKTEYSGKIQVRVSDNSGNASSECVKDSDNKDAIAVVDNTTPEMPTVNATTKVDGAEYKDEKYNGEWTNKEITVILGMEKIPTSLIKKFQYTTTKGENIKENEWKDFTETDGLFKDVTGKSINNKLIIKENQNETYKFRVVNRTGTGSDENYVWTEHDKNKLEVKLQKEINQQANEGMCNIESPVGEDDWYVEDAKITLTNIKADAEEAKIRTYYKVNDAITGNVVYEEKNFGEKFDENPVEQPEGKHEPITLYDGEYTLTYYLKDEAGNNSTSVTKTIKVDKASPKIDSMKIGEKSILDDDDKEAIKPYKSAQTIKLAASDETSKLDKIYYQISDNKRGELELKNIANWIPYNEENGITVYPNKKFIIYVKACDKAGNFSHESYSKEILIDNVNPSSEKSAPNISIEPANKSQTGYYNDDVKINISAIDPKYYGTKIDNINGVCSGLKTISYKVLNQNRQTQEGTLLEDGKKDSFNSSIVIDKNLNNSNNVVVEVIAIDNAGNTKTSKTSVSEIMIDITKPTIDVSYDNNNIVVESGKNYFKQDRQATVTITERNFNSKKVNFQITGTNGAKPTISDFRTIRAGGNGDNTKHIATITYSADGDYTFNVSYVDEAINANSGVNYARNSAAPTSFVIDKTAPKLDVSYSNNNVKNGKFFKANRIATITVVEHNFLPKNVLITKTATKNNAVIAQPALSNWVTNGDTHTATLNFNVDGDYTFDVKMSDNAKNDGVIGFGNSAAAKAFTIDTTFVNPNIDGVENGHAYKKDVVPKISFSDLNFDNYKLSLLRTTKDKINVNVTRQFVKTIKINANGGTTVIDSLKPLQENDGIYTLSVYMSDKAGNEHTTTKMFSVNRFGSVYVFGKDTIDIQNEYAQEIVKDIVVSEFNPNKLVDGSTSVEITCDGVPLAKPIFKVTQAKDTTGTTDGGWFQYNYVISADNFKKDGIYRVKVSSHDLAGNKPENTNYDDGAIIFRIDNVKPQLSSILGLEKPFIKAGSAHVKFDVFDAISLKKITVFVDGKAVKTFDKFDDAINFQGGFDIDEGVGHKIRIVMEDMAGNISDTDVENAGVNFEKTVTVSTNAFLLWYSNKALFWSTIAGAVILIGIAIFIIVKISRRKSE